MTQPSTIFAEQTGIHATLTTWIYTSFWQLWAAKQSGRECYIHWPREPGRSLSAYQDVAQFAKQPNMFDWYFRQPCVAEPPAREEVWTWEEPRPEMGRYPFMAEPLPVIRDWYHRHLRFSDAVEARGQALLARYSLDPARTIGVTWRGTDIYLDGRPRLPIDLYFPFLDAILARDASLRVACTAEEEGILDPLLARYPTAFIIREFASAPAGGKHNPERFTQVSGFERGMQPALMVWLFSKCAHYIKNRSSTGAVASWISDGNIVCLAHPETLGYSVPPIIHPTTGEQLWPKA